MMNKLYYLTVDENIDDMVFNKLLDYESVEKRESIIRLHFDIDKKLSLYSGLLVRYFTCIELGIGYSEIDIVKGKNGKPYIKGYPNFHFNISHTRNAIAVAVSRQPIGVDIERIKKADMGIVNRFFKESEQEYVKESKSESDLRFYEIWTKKEAYIKYIGKGLSIPLNSFDTLSGAVSNMIQTLEKDGYCISICNELIYQDLNIVVINENQLIEMVDSLK